MSSKSWDGLREDVGRTSISPRILLIASSLPPRILLDASSKSEKELRRNRGFKEVAIRIQRGGCEEKVQKKCRKCGLLEDALSSYEFEQTVAHAFYFHRKICSPVGLMVRLYERC